METKWQELAKRFHKLAEKTGREKSSSYVLNVIFSVDDGITVEMGTYDIADWPRETVLEPFATEEEALKATEEKIAEAEKAVERDLGES